MPRRHHWNTVKFIDLFAGIGIRMPFQELQGDCVFPCEWDARAQRTYEANFGESHPEI
jgi:DNA (cytosine-5)-methyltransferase 1